MSFLYIDQKKCIKCGICAEVCPRGIIAFSGDSFPEGVSKAAELCIQCGHCVAGCPHEALSVEGMNVSDCDEIREELAITQDEASQFIKTRRSIRVFNNKPVDKTIIENVIDIARYAPTGMNRQPVNWKIIYKKENVVRLKDMVVDWMRTLAKSGHPMAENYNFGAIAAVCLKGHDMILRNAPHVAITYAPKDDQMARGACTITLANFDLACHGYGIGTCWAGFLDLAIMASPDLQEYLSLPEGYTACGSMMMGYPKYKFYRIPQRKRPQTDWDI